MYMRTYPMIRWVMTGTLYLFVRVRQGVSGAESE